MKKAIAVKSLGFGYGLEILDIEYGLNDYAIVKWSDEEKTHRLKIYYASNDYIKLNGVRHNIEDFIRCNY